MIFARMTRRLVALNVGRIRLCEPIGSVRSEPAWITRGRCSRANHGWHHRERRNRQFFHDPAHEHTDHLRPGVPSRRRRRGSHAHRAHRRGRRPAASRRQGDARRWIPETRRSHGDHSLAGGDGKRQAGARLERGLELGRIARCERPSRHGLRRHGGAHDRRSDVPRFGRRAARERLQPHLAPRSPRHGVGSLGAFLGNGRSPSPPCGAVSHPRLPGFRSRARRGHGRK
jgi:hypothetical protein